MEIDPTSAIFTIGNVRKLTGLTDRQIRYYDQESLVVPIRTESNQRLYSLNEIERLKEIKQFLNDGKNISEIKQYYQAKEDRNFRKVHSDADTYFNKKHLQKIYPTSYLDELVERLYRK